MKRIVICLIGLLLMVSAATVWAEDPAPTVMSNKEAIELVQTHANYLWTLVAACLVFFMQAGFALVEAGFTRAKNSINILMKNLMDFSMGSLGYWAIGEVASLFGVVSCLLALECFLGPIRPISEAIRVRAPRVWIAMAVVNVLMALLFFLVIWPQVSQ